MSPSSAFVVYLCRVNFDAYAHRAADLVNASLDDLADLGKLVGAESWMADEATERDLAALRRAQKKLRDVFDLGASSRDAEAVAALNTLLETYPVQPRISGHDTGDWHMHVTSRGALVSAEYLAGAVWGLAVWLCEYGSARFGVCADARCGKVYLDTSSNCCRRFCSERCATRSHVAAHRARKRAAVGPTDPADALEPDAPLTAAGPLKSAKTRAPVEQLATVG